jgi:hypothetical protein
MRVSKASWVAVLAVVVGLAGLVQWRASAAEGQQEERKTEPEKKPQPAAAAKRITTVYLRGEAVGLDLNYVPPASSMPRVQGELVRIDADWVVLSGKGKESMVAKSAVLMIVTEGQ